MSKSRRSDPPPQFGEVFLKPGSQVNRDYRWA